MPVRIRAAVFEYGMGEAPYVAKHLEMDGLRAEAGVFADLDPPKIKKAIVLEFGSQDVEARMFIRKAADGNLPKYVRMMERTESVIVDGRNQAGLAMGNIGRALVADIKKAILREGLVDTGELYDDISFKIEGSVLLF